MLRLVVLMAGLACTLAIGVAGAAQPAGPAAYAARVGLAAHTVRLPPTEGYTLLQRARAGGVRWVREDFAWSGIERSPGRFDWRRTDALMRNASRLGISVLGMLGYAPAWASQVPGDDKYPPRSAQAYARFVVAVLDRYGARGTFWRASPRLKPRPLTAVEIWNEPWHSGFWKPAPDPAAYTALFRAAAEALAVSHQRVQLLASADLLEQEEGRSEPSPWFSELLAADPALWSSDLVDGWTVHLYSRDRGPDDRSIPQPWRFDRVLLTRELAVAANAMRPIWITELGWSTEGPGSLDEEGQARYTRAALVKAVEEWRPFVARSFVYLWGHPSARDPWSLIREDGSTRPAWGAITSLLLSGG